MNTEIDVCIYRHFLGEKHSKADEERDLTDRYNVLRDGAKSDADVSQQEIAEAQARYVFWRDRAGEISTRRLGMGQEMAARVDHARGGGPRGSAGSTSSGGAGIEGASLRKTTAFFLASACEAICSTSLTAEAGTAPWGWPGFGA